MGRGKTFHQVETFTVLNISYFKKSGKRNEIWNTTFTLWAVFSKRKKTTKKQRVASPYIYKKIKSRYVWKGGKVKDRSMTVCWRGCWRETTIPPPFPLVTAHSQMGWKFIRRNNNNTLHSIYTVHTYIHTYTPVMASKWYNRLLLG